jgi:predicted fused transcriptional regulator/phosphomethylpyrimidine kinase/predicted transcriptional regulator
MRPPCELVQREYLPRVRTKVAKTLSKHGLPQTEIAERMGLTQAAVSKYLNRTFTQSDLDSEAAALASRLCDMILAESSGMDAMLKAICSHCMILRIGSTTCNLHRASIGELGELNCQICTDLLGGPHTEFAGRAEVLQDFLAALKHIENDANFQRIMPQVRANLVTCHKTAKTVSDVVGVPGRITLINGRARALVSPQYGASRHTATILLKVREGWSKVRACLCVSGKDEVVEAARKSGFAIIKRESSTTDAQEIAMQAHTASVKKKGLPAIHVPGGVGVEPILYLFGNDALQLAKYCSDISSSL